MWGVINRGWLANIIKYYQLHGATGVGIITSLFVCLDITIYSINFEDYDDHDSREIGA